MGSDDIFLGISLILVLAVGSQILARRLRIPALIVLLPAGFHDREPWQSRSGC
jgi:Kef-type K+ transport system membrane component KefB